MSPCRVKLLCLVLALLFVKAQAALSGESPSSPVVEVLYIPREDLSRAPGYSDAGVFLPLSELMALARQAQRSAEGAPPVGAVTCSSIQLRGVLKTGLSLEGRLSFKAPEDGWSAVLIDDGTVPWTAQETTTGTLAFLARIGGCTYLFAKGPSSGTLQVRAVFPISLSGPETTLSFGRIFAPCRVDLDLGTNAEIASSTVPVTETKSPDRRAEGSAKLAASTSVAIWPTQQQAAQIAIRRKVPLTAPSSLRVKLARTVQAVGAGLEVTDEIVLEDRFVPGVSLEVPLPAGLRVLRLETDNKAQVEVSTATVRLTPLEQTNSLSIRAVFAALLQNETATMGQWDFPAVAQSASLTLRSTDQYAPFLKTHSASLTARPGTLAERHYECWGPLPPLEVALIARRVPQPPVVSAQLAIVRNEATARFDVQLPDKNRNDLTFLIPSEWVLVDCGIARGETFLPFALQQEQAGWWRVAWDGAAAVEKLHFTLHRVGAWGAPASTASLAIPLVRFQEPRPARYEVVLSWPEEIETHVGSLSGISVVSTEELPASADRSQVPPIKAAGPLRLALRVIGDSPGGLLTIRGRDSDVQATIVSSLSIGEDRATVRALIAYDVRLAPASAFRFSLPAGTGRVVKIQGEAIRETSLNSTPDRDEWTVITQRGVTGRYPLTMEWTLRERPVEQAIVAPEIRALGVTSQRGFLVLQGSETLQLTAETKNLAEADLVELPSLPWTRESRVLAAYRYIEPPYWLRVTAEKFRPEPALKALVREGALTTTLSPDGQRLTLARYTVTPTSDQQFFEIRLPKDALLWSVLINGQGARPAQRPSGDGGTLLLVPLPAISGDMREFAVAVLYQEQDAPLLTSTQAFFAGPAVSVPVNRTEWNLNLPPGYEYLTFGGSMARGAAVREPAAHFFRTAYYPSRLVFMETSVGAIIFWTVLGVVVILAIGHRKWLIKIAGLRVGGRPRGDVMVGGEGASVARGPGEAAGPEGALRAEARPRPSGCLGRLAILVVIGVVILVLFSISVPNFMEAQVRAKVSRIRTDMRSLATALEAYYVDHNAYPERLETLWQGPVKYITAPPADPFALSYAVSDVSGRTGVRYKRSPEGANWQLYSVGPDLADDQGQFPYDPTNGTVSGGDVFRTKDGAAPVAFTARFAQLRREEMRDRAASRYAVVAPTPRPAGAIAVAGLLTEGRPPVVSAEPGIAVSDVEQPRQAGAGWMFAPGDIRAKEIRAGAEDAGARRFIPPIARQAGLLSLNVEIPIGGVQRRFEALGGDARMEIRLLGQKQYQRLRFIVWLAAFLLMVGLWLIDRRAFRVAFVAAIGVTLAAPIVVQVAWSAFFNAAFQGALFSLVAPLLSVLWKHAHRHLGASSAAILLCILALHSPARAGQEPVVGPIEPSSARPAVRILVPYDLNTTKPFSVFGLKPKQSPLAFISKEDFARLWNAAYPELLRPARPAPILAVVHLNGALVVERSAIEGDLWLLAANPSDSPATLPLRLAGLTLREWSGGGAGVAMDAAPDGLLLRMQPNWAGTVSARWVLPCETQGASGRLKIELPETAAGLLRFTIPYPELIAAVTGKTGCVTETADAATIVVAPMRPGPFELSWRPIRATGVGAAETTPTVSTTRWQARIETHVTWPTLAGAQWRSTIALRPVAPGTPLPSEVQFGIDPGLSIYSADGAQLLSAAIEPSRGAAGAPAPSPLQKTTLKMRLAEARSAQIVLEGVVTAPPTEEKPDRAGGQLMRSWSVPGIRPPQGVNADTVLTLEVANQIEVVSVDASRLERRSAYRAAKDYSTQVYQTDSADWEARLQLRPLRAAFTAQVSELFVPSDGSLRQAATIQLSPRAGLLHECALELPPGVRATTLQGKSVSGWIQSESHVLVAFDPPVSQPTSLEMTAVSDLPDSTAALSISPLTLPGAAEVRRTVAVFVPADSELAELDLAKAVPQPPTVEQQRLVPLATGDGPTRAGALRSYVLASEAPLRFAFKPIEATSLDTVYNRVRISEGLQTLDCVVRSEPRRGRLRSVEAILLLPAPDPGAASRLQAGGPALRSIQTEPISDRAFRVVAQLTAPQSNPVSIYIHLEQPVFMEEGKTIGTMAFVPAPRAGARAFLLLRRAFEGELNPADVSGARSVDPATVQWPDASFRPLPSDRAFELAPATAVSPSFAITRHAREEALRAVVEVMRQRTILTADGLERNELELVVQNQSEQFLKIALPYPRNQITLYQTQVASRDVRATFGREAGREVLLVPLIRTGLLDPELTVRVAYAVETNVSLRGRGRRQQRLPEVLGGVPVSQSALVLMLPQNFKCSRFKGSLNQVESVDLEVDEALRRAKRAERLSEIALFGDVKTQEKAHKKLVELDRAVSSQISLAKQYTQAQKRETERADFDSREIKARQDELIKARGVALQQAEEAEQKIAVNVEQLKRLSPERPAPTVPPETAAEPPVGAVAPTIAFPRVGDVFVFRQLQGTGAITFRYGSRESAERRNDVLFALGLTVLIGLVTLGSRFLLASVRRVVFCTLVVCLVAVALRVALDVAIPVAAVALLVLFLKRQRPPLAIRE